VVIDNFDVARVAVVPYETYSVLIIDSDTMLSESIAFQWLKPITRQRKVVQCPRLMDRPEFSPRHVGDILKSWHRFTIEDRLSLLVAEALDHASCYSATRLLTSRECEAVNDYPRRANPRTPHRSSPLLSNA
jgi:hypothetical protein